MSGRRRSLFRVARAMISDDAIVSGLVRFSVMPMSGESRGLVVALCCLALQLGTMAAVAIAGEYWMSNSKERSCVDGEYGTAGSERTTTRAA